MKFHVDGTVPTNGEIFVFGSNLGGQHRGGAARFAAETFGARWGIGVGPSGHAYAIPTVNETLESVLPSNIINVYIEQFIEYAMLRKDLSFFITAIGCGIAGYKHAVISRLFKGAPDNCDFPKEWEQYLISR